MSFPNTPSQKFRAALASQTASLALLDRLYFKLQATQPNFDPLYSLRNTDPSTRQTSLHIAANAGRLNVVEWLLEQGVEAEISRVSPASPRSLTRQAHRKRFLIHRTLLARPFSTSQRRKASSKSSLYISNAFGSFTLYYL